MIIAGSPGERAVDVVTADNRSGSIALVTHLVEDHRRRRLYHVEGPPTAPDAEERSLALAQVLDSHPGCQLVGTFHGSFSVQSGEEAGEMLLAMPAEARPDAVVCANDQMAIGVLQALARGGVRVPEDMAVVGFDDIFPGSLFRPSLTTVHQPMRLLGERACARLLDRISDPSLQPPSSCCRPSWCSARAAAARPAPRSAAGSPHHSSPSLGADVKFILRRLAFYLVAAWVALTVNFFIPRAMPGNAVQAIMSKFPNLQPSAYQALEAMLGVGHPGSLWHQYWAYLDDVFHLNFGTDVIEYPAQVSTLLVQTIPWTLTLVGTATVIAFLVGTGLGIVAGWRHGGWLDRVLPGPDVPAGDPLLLPGADPDRAAGGPDAPVPDRPGLRRRPGPRLALAVHRQRHLPLAAARASRS